jgi:hypothetical protein
MNRGIAVSHMMQHKGMNRGIAVSLTFNGSHSVSQLTEYIGKVKSNAIQQQCKDLMRTVQEENMNHSINKSINTSINQ